MTQNKIFPPYKWHGGKFYLAKWIISHFPPHVHYVEPYFGGGNVLLQKPAKWIEGISEVVNDINGELTNFWLQLRDNRENLLSALECMPLNENEFEHSLFTVSADTSVQRAIKFFVRYRQSRQGLGKDFATMTRTRTRRGMNEQVSQWLSAIDGLPETCARIERVAIFNRDAINVIEQQDGPDTLFYIDPTYLHETRVTTADYEHEMTPEQHQTLLKTLAYLQGSFLLSGYRSELYDNAATRYGWYRVEKEIDIKASSATTKPKRVECLWMNYQPNTFDNMAE